MVQYSLCHGMDKSTCDIAHWLAAPHHRTAFRTGVWVCNVLMFKMSLGAHYFLDIILFLHDFHHDSCDYHWDFYSH